MDRSGISKIIGVVVATAIVIGTASAYFFVFQSGAPAQQQISPAPQAEQPPPAPIAEHQQPVQPPALPRQPAQPPPAEQQPVQPPAGAFDPAKADTLKTAVEGHFKKFAAKDVPNLLVDYTQTGTYVEWSGQAGAFAGKYNGYPRVRILYATIAGNIQDLVFRFQDYKADISGDTATVTMKVVGHGTGKLIGAFDMEVDATQKWVYQSGKWLLQDDRWNFTLFKTELAAEGTVFPINWRKIGDFSGWNDRIKSLFGN